jgi:hypothetical protein
VLQGAPEAIAEHERSHTGRALRDEYARAGIELGGAPKKKRRAS